jgi:hypothetical protein
VPAEPYAPIVTPNRTDVVLATVFAVVGLAQVTIWPIADLGVGYLYVLGTTLPLAWRRTSPASSIRLIVCVIRLLECRMDSAIWAIRMVRFGLSERRTRISYSPRDNPWACRSSRSRTSVSRVVPTM